MDEMAFERVIRIVATSPSRRTALRGLVIAVLGGLAGYDPSGVVAKGGKKGKKGPGKKKKKKNNPPPTCSDGKKNGDETGVDCGGSCPRCGTGQGCARATDCASDFCGNNTCQVCQELLQPCGADSLGACECYPLSNANRDGIGFGCVRSNDMPSTTTPDCADGRVLVFTSLTTFACAKRCGAP